MGFVSGLYEGEISDARAKAWRRTRTIMLLVDLDELDALQGRFRLLSSRRLGLAPKAQVEAELARAGLAHGGPVRALRTPGFAAYLCHDRDGALSAVRYVVSKRGEERCWLAPASMESGMARLHADGRTGRTYALRLRPPGETVQIALDAADPGAGFAFATSFIGRRRALSGWGLLRAAAAGAGRLAAGVAEALGAWETAEAPAVERRLAA